MGFIKRLFGGAEKPVPAIRSGLERQAETTALDVDPQAVTRRELVRMLTRDSLRFSGIPDGWIESQVLLELGRGGQAFIHLRLVVKHWDERLLQYAVAFQRRLRSEVERFEPGAREWLLSITWQYEVDDQCPYVLMPDPSLWVPPGTGGVLQAPVTVAAPSAASQEEAEMQSDLARLFAVRDANLTDANWEPTSLSGLPELGPNPGKAAGTSRGRPSK